MLYTPCQLKYIFQLENFAHNYVLSYPYNLENIEQTYELDPVRLKQIQAIYAELDLFFI